ncbi:MAG: citrate synthase [Alphaproteobacteria bacterium]|nr:citrate synthase [Alphaproteobacteria bacterium]
MSTASVLDAAAAARSLRVTRATLYAYVSRGMIATEPDPANPRRRLYRAADVARLLKAKERGRKPQAIAAAALDWGVGALASRITLVEGGRLFYRGQDAAVVAEHATLEDVTGLLWDCGDHDPFHDLPAPDVPWRILPKPYNDAPPIERCRALLPLSDAGARAMWNREPARLALDGASLLRAIVACMLGTRPDAAPIHAQVARAWRLDRAGADLVRATLVLLADHELNASTFAARVVASTGASLNACVSAGLAALSGPLHGGATALAELLLEEAEQTGDAPATVEARLRRGERIPAFGHPLYPDQDPRADFLLQRLPKDAMRDALIAAVDDIVGQPPNVDFALASLRRALHLPPGSGLVLFAVARSVGWIAHALEQNAEKKLIRPRAEYVGIRPE